MQLGACIDTCLHDLRYNRWLVPGSFILKVDHGVGDEGVINSCASSRLYLCAKLEFIGYSSSRLHLCMKLECIGYPILGHY